MVRISYGRAKGRNQAGSRIEPDSSDGAESGKTDKRLRTGRLTKRLKIKKGQEG